ncbi:MAG: molybdenum cofactor biosynthesis protein MoaE [Caldisphaeraceae archaeon]|nr:molybdenum cofactor biosynthesis protein MoaE [Caldisphaeraceae archaeon]MEB3692361.1 molybdenum cofactor biosynthesis protein MoaE [Caldisphaeraceae archaeon]MEB3798215.1 molybdenum cofactor biosynthesis protein MoaE [Caldisphaeraceae archaeon]
MTKIKLYSILREIAGTGEVHLKIDSCLSVEELIRKLSLHKVKDIVGDLKFLQVIADGKPLSFNDVIKEDVKEVFILPPSSGGLIDVKVLADKSIDLNELVRKMYSNYKDGAIAIFVGVVRGINKNEKVEKLYYEHSSELAEEALRKIAEENMSNYKLSSVIIYHYVGYRRPGDLSMVVAVVGESRKNVFPALEKIVDDIKHRAPIWKEEYRESGRYFLLGDREIKASSLP